MVNQNAEPQAEELSPQQQLQWCLDNLGQRITTVGIGQLDAQPVTQWVTSESVPMEAVAPISVLYGAAKRVTDVYGDQTARAFLRSSNPYVGDRSLLEFTASAGVDIEAARAMVDNAVSAFLD